jgi:hypothetical protein
MVLTRATRCGKTLGYSKQKLDSGKLPGRTVRAIGKQVYGNIVHTFPTAIVHTIEPVVFP